MASAEQETGILPCCLLTLCQQCCLKDLDAAPTSLSSSATYGDNPLHKVMHKLCTGAWMQGPAYLAGL